MYLNYAKETKLFAKNGVSGCEISEGNGVSIQDSDRLSWVPEALLMLSFLSCYMLLMSRVFLTWLCHSLQASSQPVSLWPALASPESMPKENLWYLG